MTKLFVLYRRSYGDFDIRHDDPIAASSIKEHLKIEAASKNDRRTPEEIKREVEFWVSPKADLRLL
jgi:hypothetical protein